MALTEIPIELSSTPSIVDGGNALETGLQANIDTQITPTTGEGVPW